MRLVTLGIGIAGLVGLLAFLGVPSSQGQPEPPELVARTPPKTPEEEQKLLRVPPGFEVQLVAAEPDIRKPMNIAFDDRGRLWVTDSVEYPFPAPPDRTGRDTIKILEDTDGDGRADKVTTFADGLNIPIGILPIKNGAIVFSIPNIYRMLDTDGDDRADKRQVLFGPFGHVDTHGMCSSFTWGFDGWVYATHGFANNSKVKGTDGHTVTMHSGNTFRFKPDGSRIEQFTWGQVNPFGLSFDPLGNLYSADCHTKPIMMLLRGGYYQSFGKPHDGLGFAPEICQHDHSSTGIAGITFYAADHFPPEYRDTIFIGNVLTNRINHDRLERHGSTFLAKPQADFLVSDDPWFRPVDIKLGPDGALYVADFYNRIIGHYEVPLTHPGRDRERGRIWRIVYRGPDGKGKPPQAPRKDWTKAGFEQLYNDLGHPNLVVRTKATNQLVDRGDETIRQAIQNMLRVESNSDRRVHCHWILHRLDPTGPVEGRGVHALRMLAERAKPSDAERRWAIAALNDRDPLAQRIAAEALGRHPSRENIRPLLELQHNVPADDVQLLHMVRMALRDQLRRPDVWPELARLNCDEKDMKALADVATGVPDEMAARFLLAHLQQRPEERGNQVRYVHHVARYGTTDSVSSLLAYARDNRPADLGHQAALFKAIQQGTQERGAPLSEDARKWAEELAGKLLSANQNELVLAGIDIAGSAKIASMQGAIKGIAAGKESPEPQRRAAMSALVSIAGKEHMGLLGNIIMDAREPFPLREHAVHLLAGINQPEAHTELVKALATAPARLAAVIAAGLAGSPQGAEKLLDAVATGKASAHLLQERVVQLRLQQSKVSNLQERLAKLTRGLPAADERLRDLMRRRQAGFVQAKTDVAIGAKVFEKNCATCHQIAGQGAKIGPQLDGIGVRGLDRLLEDIVDPNRNIDQAFRASVLHLTNGQIVSGLVLREEGEVIVLADAQGKEVRISKKDIDERAVSPLSPMPANQVEQIPEADFYHLLAYLLTQRQQK